MVQILLGLLLALQPNQYDTETKEEREARLTVIAQAIVVAVDEQTCSGKFDVPECKKTWGSRKELAVALVVQGNAESNFAENVHAGNCRPLQCDSHYVRDPKTRRYARDADGKKVREFRARNVWQNQARGGGEDRALWDVSLGDSLEATTASARLAASYLGRRRCGGDVAKMYQSMDGAGCRTGKRGDKRSREFRRLSVEYDKEAQRLRRDTPPEKTASL